jgi:hypothetical protein
MMGNEQPVNVLIRSPSKPLVDADHSSRVMAAGSGQGVADRRSMSEDSCRLRFSQSAWAGSMKVFKNGELRTLGPTKAIREMASRCKKQWFRGLGVCRAVFDVRK